MKTERKQHLILQLVHAKIWVLLLALVVSSCSEDDETGGNRPQIISDDLEIFTMIIEDEAGNVPNDPNDLLFENFTHQPVMAPDGHQITFGEFSLAKGKISMICEEDGTQMSLSLSGLIPNGVYSVWILAFEAPGFTPTFEHEIAEGAWGAADGSEGEFIASAEGTANVSAFTPAGDLSAFGAIGSCVPSEAYEIQIHIAYHLDGQTHGPVVGPEGTWVVQAAYVFKNEEPSNGY